MRFRVLGPVRLEPRTPSAAKQRAVLAALLLRAGRVVSASSLFDELWPQGPPRTAATTLQVYVSHLRKAIGEGGGTPLETRAPGYLLRVAPGEFDLARFEELHRDGRGAARRGDFVAVSRTLGEALALWQGPAVSGVEHGPALAAAAARLEELRLEAIELRIEADLRLGRHEELTGELTELAHAHPLREQLHCHLMEALRRAGRTADALRAYRTVRRALHDELGVEPGPGLARAHSRVVGGPVPVSRSAFPVGSRRASAVPSPDDRVIRAHRRSA